MPTLAKPRITHDKFKFLVEVDGLGSAAFQKASEPRATAAVVDHWEGGSIVSEKTPGRLSFSAVTLERGATMDLDLFLWFQEVAQAAANLGLPSPGYERDVDIVQLDRDRTTLMHYRLFGAWPSEYSPGDWDNTADEKRIEVAVLQYRHFLPIPVGSLT